METWTTIIVAAIVVFASIFSAFMTNRQNNKRFEKELERRREIDSHQWRRTIRSEPLLKLRNALATMATKQERLVRSAHQLHTRFGKTEEEALEALGKSTEDIITDIESGDFQVTLSMQCDKELVNKVEEIIKEYRSSYIDAIHYKDLKARELGEAMEVFRRNKDRIIEVQEL